MNMKTLAISCLSGAFVFGLASVGVAETAADRVDAAAARAERKLDADKVEMQKRIDRAESSYSEKVGDARDRLDHRVDKARAEYNNEANRVENRLDRVENRADRMNRDDSQSVGEYLDDAKVTAAVKAHFLGQKGIDTLDIHVETNDGVVTLSGEVEDSAQIPLAEKTAREADGARRVINNLTVKR